LGGEEFGRATTVNLSDGGAPAAQVNRLVEVLEFSEKVGLRIATAWRLSP
jgi:hypothetical protein